MVEEQKNTTAGNNKFLRMNLSSSKRRENFEFNITILPVLALEGYVGIQGV